MFLTKANRPFVVPGQFIKERSLPFFRENSKLLAQAIFTIFFIGLGIWFIKHEPTQFADVKRMLLDADWKFVVAGLLLTVVYILLQGLMYVASFASIRHRISPVNAVVLFLKRNLKSIYYRVSEDDIGCYKSLKKKVMFLGQEGLVDLKSFSLEGGSKKSIRNALSKVKDRGFKTSVHTAPVKDGLLQKIKAVSDEWLEETGRKEIIFSQGMFVWEDLKQQTLITVENSEEKVVAFLNIIPDFARGEGTYDLIRKTTDAPNGVMDFIIVELFLYLKSEGYSFANMGFAPMSGIDDPHTFKEKSMKFAYEKIRGFSQYKGLREYKEKFVTVWINKYLIYDHDYDLLQIPGALMKVIKPE